jgi:glycosyltransferase involved in cell wall biosynthesis
MKVLQIVPSISLIYGGPSQMVIGLSEALARSDVEVTILTTNSNGDAGQPLLQVPLATPLSQNGYQIVYFACSPFRRYKFSLGLLNWLARQAHHYDIAHIHALFSPVSTAAAIVCRQQQLPYLLRPLGTLDPADLRKKQQLKKIYAAVLEKPNLAGAAGLHFTSEPECQVSQRFGVKTRDFVVPLGVSFPESLPEKGMISQQLGIPSQVPSILFMSRIDPKKGLDLLLPALENLLAKGIDFHFVLAGSNPQDSGYENQIGQQIERSPLRERTTIAGFVQGEVKLGLLQDADLFALPSYYENFGIAVAEAMAVGTPVVISDRVQIQEAIAGAAAGWVTRCTIEDLTQTLETALADPDARKLRGENARQLAIAQYSWDAIAKQMAQVYNQILIS